MRSKSEATSDALDGDGAEMAEAELMEATVAQPSDERDFPSTDTAPYLIATIARLLAAEYLGDIKGKGITSAQAFVLRELMRCSPQTQVGIARNMGLSKVSIGETLNRLEAAGLIARERSSTDRRSIAISLTPKSRAMKQALVLKSYGQLELVENILGAGQMDQLTQLLRRLEEDLRAKLGKVHPRFE